MTALNDLSNNKIIGIIANSRKKEAPELVDKIRTWLNKHDAESMDSYGSSVDQIFEKASLIVCLGGDGTILRVASQMKQRSIPILGVNLGSLGFLTEVKVEEVYEELNNYLLDQYETEKRLMLSCQAWSESAKEERRFLALNDMVLGREGLSRLLKLEVKVNGETLTVFSGDGVIVATPTGSTAYSLSAGGAIVHPKMEAIVITPICPHASALRPLVVSGNDKITIGIQKRGDSSKGVLSADGQENLEIDDSYTIEITQASSPLQLIKSSKRNYLETLRENFKFPAS